MLEDGLTRDESGKRTEKTGERSLFFSQWHRKFLSNRCYATDVDLYEYRIDGGRYEPKALIEVKRGHVRQAKYLASPNIIALFTLARRADVRFMVILYEPDEGRPPEEVETFSFWVWEPESVDEIEDYSEDRFEEFFRRYTSDELISLIEGL